MFELFFSELKPLIKFHSTIVPFLGSLGEKLDQAIKEYLSYKAYLEANEAFNEWFRHFKSKPIPPEELSENAPFPEKVAHQHRQSQFMAELER